MVCVGEAVGFAARAHSMVDQLRMRLRHVAKSVAGECRPKVLCLSSVWPPVLAGKWVPELVSLAGGLDGLQEPGNLPQPVVWENVTSYSPDVILLLADFDNMQRTRLEVNVLPELLPHLGNLLMEFSFFKHSLLILSSPHLFNLC